MLFQFGVFLLAIDPARPFPVPQPLAMLRRDRRIGVLQTEPYTLYRGGAHVLARLAPGRQGILLQGRP